MSLWSGRREIPWGSTGTGWVRSRFGDDRNLVILSLQSGLGPDPPGAGEVSGG